MGKCVIESLQRAGIDIPDDFPSEYHPVGELDRLMGRVGLRAVGGYDVPWKFEMDKSAAVIVVAASTEGFHAEYYESYRAFEKAEPHIKPVWIIPIDPAVEISVKLEGGNHE